MRILQRSLWGVSACPLYMQSLETEHQEHSLAHVHVQVWGQVCLGDQSMCAYMLLFLPCVKYK